MQPRTRLRRPLAVLVGVWFALFSAVAPVAAPCAMSHPASEASGASHATARESAPSAAEVSDPHLGHAAHAVPAGEQGPSDAPAPFDPCDCATSCCSVPTSALPAPPAAVATATVVPSTRVAREVPCVRVASRPRLLPFAQAPPA